MPDITRPALSDERVQLNAAGQVELKLKPPWRYGTTHLMMSALEFMQRLAALVLRPRLQQSTTASRLSILVVGCSHWVEMVCTLLPLRRLRTARSEIVPTFALIRGRPSWEQLADLVIRTTVNSGC